MHVECCCATVIEAGEVAAIADAFVAHGLAAHEWSRPDRAAPIPGRTVPRRGIA